MLSTAINHIHIPASFHTRHPTYAYLCSRWRLIISVQQTTYWNTTTYITMRSDLSLSNNALRFPYGTIITYSRAAKHCSYSALIDVNKFEIRDPFPNGSFCFIFYGSFFRVLPSRMTFARNPRIVPCFTKLDLNTVDSRCYSVLSHPRSNRI